MSDDRRPAARPQRPSRGQAPRPGQRAPRGAVLPLLISVPHAGLRVPPEAEPYAATSPDEILADGDGGAGAIYDIDTHARAFVTTDIARAIVDMNRAPDDVRKDGVVKTHTCWDVPVYREPLPTSVAARLIDRYHRPYHERLRALATDARVLAGVDCHTMAAVAPPEAPDPGEPRPRICLSNAHGTLPEAWFQQLAHALEDAFGTPPSLNQPFQGGYIIREHSAELPWVQIELSREPWITLDEKRERVLAALAMWSRSIEAEIPSGRPHEQPTAPGSPGSHR